MANEYILKSFDGGAQTTTLTSGFTVGNGTLTVANGTSFPNGSAGKFVVVVDRGLATEEKFLITSTSGASSVSFTISNAGYDGTSAVNHNVGATVDHCLDAYTVEQANRYVNLQATKGSLITHTGTTTAALTASATNNLTLLTDSTIANGIKWAQIVEASIADNAVTAAKIAANAVGSSELADNAVDTAAIVNSAVTTAKIADLNVTTAKIADLSVTTAKIADLNVTTGKLNDLSVTTGKLDALAVTGAKIANSTITAGKLDTAYVQQGTGTLQFPNAVKIGWNNASQLRVQVDTTDFGTTWPININGNAATVTGSTSANTANAIVQRNGSGGFAAQTIDIAGGGAFGSYSTLTSNGVLRTGVISNTNTPLTTNGPTNTYHATFHNSGEVIGSIYHNGSGVTYNTTSDYRLKENVIPLVDALKIIEMLTPKTYNFISNPTVTEHGFFAHELAEVIPYAVAGEKDAIDEEGNIKPQQVDYSKLVAVLVGAVQELSARITELENK